MRDVVEHRRPQHECVRGNTLVVDAAFSRPPNSTRGIFVSARYDGSIKPRHLLTRIDPLERAKLSQITHEHIRLFRGREPDDPFEIVQSTTRGLSADQLVLLNRIAADPHLAEHYPHTKAYLDDTPDDSPETICVAAKAAMNEYLEGASGAPRSSLSTEMQDLHDLIASQVGLSDQAKLILLMTTFIPEGRYTSYNAIREWLRDVGEMTRDSHIAAALRKGTSLFNLNEVPAHRVVERNGGVGHYSCEWGSHMSDMEDDERIVLLEDEGARFDKNRRLLGGCLEFHEVEKPMKASSRESQRCMGRAKHIIVSTEEGRSMVVRKRSATPHKHVAETRPFVAILQIPLTFIAVSKQGSPYHSGCGSVDSSITISVHHPMTFSQYAVQAWATCDKYLDTLRKAIHELSAVVETCRDEIHAEELKMWLHPITWEMTRKKSSLAKSQQTLKHAIECFHWVYYEANNRRRNGRSPSSSIFFDLELCYFEDFMALIFAVKGPIVTAIAILEGAILAYADEEVPARQAFEREDRWSWVPMTAECMAQTCQQPSLLICFD
ncbi:hypothetical protein EK21DRAFT_85577 [Setomelanomma holmii]|uniref:Uncharacterized protein n=1 Tax=Setomelanomma holmii TaxID=210430 RepID=A0A9P4HH24_9PLEO|nr:hypothetical protein EK21DRAFT_85577 [Setomelanomma holmii]